MAIIVYPLNGTKYSAEDAQTYLCTRTSGVYSDENHFTLGEVTADRRITIGAGLAWMKISEFGGISFAVTEPVTISVEGADANTPRTDLIVLRHDGNSQTNSVVCKKNSNSVQQSDGIFELALYRIQIPAGSTQIIASQIEDVRATELCGIMTDGVRKIPTETLRATFEAQLNEIISNGNDSLSEFIETSTNAVESFNDLSANEIDSFKKKASNAITDISSAATRAENFANATIENFEQRGNEALEDLQENIEKIGAGTDAMLQSAFNPSGQTGQVAFEKTSMQIADYNPSGEVGQVAFEKNARTEYFKAAYIKHGYSLDDVIFVYAPGQQDLYNMIVNGKIPFIRAFAAKYAGDRMTLDEQHSITVFLENGIGNFDSLFDPKEKTIDFQFVEFHTEVDRFGNENYMFVFSTRLNSVVTDVTVIPDPQRKTISFQMKTLE